MHGESNVFNPDHLLDPPEISTGVEQAIGVISIVVASLGLMAFARMTRGSTKRQTWAGVYGPLALLAAYVGLVYRIAILPVGGANIGGALLLFTVIPFTLCLCGLAAYFGIKANRTIG